MSDLVEGDRVKYRRWTGVVLGVEVDSAVDVTWCYVMFRTWRALTGWRYWYDYKNAADLVKVCNVDHP